MNFDVSIVPKSNMANNESLMHIIQQCRLYRKCIYQYLTQITPFMSISWFDCLLLATQDLLLPFKWTFPQFTVSPFEYTELLRIRFRHNLEVFVLQSYAEYMVRGKTEKLQIFLQIFGLWVISYICVFRKDNIRTNDV